MENCYQDLKDVIGRDGVLNKHFFLPF